jgi:hypothetical protein
VNVNIQLSKSSFSKSRDDIVVCKLYNKVNLIYGSEKTMESDIAVVSFLCRKLAIIRARSIRESKAQ